ncbi:MAG: ZIP family metal transporter [Bacillota bacterium]
MVINNTVRKYVFKDQKSVAGGGLFISGQEMGISLVSGLATGFGALLAAVNGWAGGGAIPVLLGLSSGIGFTVVFFDLLPESVVAGSLYLAIAGVLSGFLFGRLIDSFLPHLGIHDCWGNTGQWGGRGGVLGTGYLFTIGVAMHNLPEGMAMGAGMESGNGLGFLLASAIGFHNIPEGMALCAVLSSGGITPVKSVAASTAAGFMLPCGTALAMLLLDISSSTVSFLLAVGAGTLLYIILADLLPLSLRLNSALAKAGLAAGTMMAIMLSGCF